MDATIEKTGVNTYYSIIDNETNQSYSVSEMYDVNSDSTEYEITHTSEPLSEEKRTEIIEAIQNAEDNGEPTGFILDITEKNGQQEYSERYFIETNNEKTALEIAKHKAEHWYEGEPEHIGECEVGFDDPCVIVSYEIYPCSKQSFMESIMKNRIIQQDYQGLKKQT